MCLITGDKCFVVVVADGVKHEGPLVLATGVAGFTAAIIVSVFADTGHSRPAQLARCAMGFFVAVVWIMAIADEVVNVLKVITSLQSVKLNPYLPPPPLSPPPSFSPPPPLDIRPHLRPLRRDHRAHDLRRGEQPGRLRRQPRRRGLRARHGLLRVLRRAHAQHPPRRRHLRLVRDVADGDAV